MSKGASLLGYRHGSERKLGSSYFWFGVVFPGFFVVVLFGVFWLFFFVWLFVLHFVVLFCGGFL